MSDLIRREDAMKAVRDYKRWHFLELVDITSALNGIPSVDAVEVVRCGECIYYDPPHVENYGERIEYADLPKEAFDELGTRFVTMNYGINIGGRCTVDYYIGCAEDKRVFRSDNDYCSRGERKNEPQTERSK